MRLSAIVWRRGPGDTRTAVGVPGIQYESAVIPSVFLGDDSVPQEVRRAIIARLKAGDHNGRITHGRCVYEWQG